MCWCLHVSVGLWVHNPRTPRLSAIVSGSPGVFMYLWVVGALASYLGYLWLVSGRAGSSYELTSMDAVFSVMWVWNFSFKITSHDSENRGVAAIL